MFALLLTCVLLSDPGNLEGKIVRIADGDTITVLVYRMQVKVRLSTIDAPERGQDFSQRSRQALADLVGRGDLGVNRKRMEQIQQAFQQQGSP